MPAPSTPFRPATEATEEQTTAALEIPAIGEACRQRGRVKAASTRDGKIIAIDHGKQLVSLWNVSRGTEIVAFSTVAAVDCMAFSPDGALLATGDAKGGVMLWKTEGTLIGQVQHDEPISHLAFNPDGSNLAVASRDSALRLWIPSPDVLTENVKAKASGPLSEEEWKRYLGDEPRAVE